MFDGIFDQDYATSIPITSVFTMDVKIAIWGKNFGIMDVRLEPCFASAKDITVYRIKKVPEAGPFL